MSATNLFTIALCIGGFLLSVVLTKVSILIASGRGIVDVPNARSSHKTPVPRGGGIPFVVLFLGALAVSGLLGEAWGAAGVTPVLLAGGGLAAGVGFFDDVVRVSPFWRLLTHLSAAIVALVLLPSMPSLPLFDSVIEPGTVLVFVYLLGLVWSINLFNFMDGVDGIAGVEALSMLLGALVILEIQGMADWRQLLLFLASCIAGFLVWNWPPAKVFMGDAASGFLGFCLGTLALATSADGSLNLWVWLILGGVFLVDATATLIVRIFSGETWYRAHRSHAYQILSRRLQSHTKVTLAVLCINLFWLFPLALFAAREPSLAVLLWLVAWAPLVVLVIIVGAGKTGVAEPATSSLK